MSLLNCVTHDQMLIVQGHRPGAKIYQIVLRSETANSSVKLLSTSLIIVNWITIQRCKIIH